MPHLLYTLFKQMFSNLVERYQKRKKKDRNLSVYLLFLDVRRKHSKWSRWTVSMRGPWNPLSSHATSAKNFRYVLMIKVTVSPNGQKKKQKKKSAPRKFTWIPLFPLLHGKVTIWKNKSNLFLKTRTFLSNPGTVYIIAMLQHFR